MTSALDDSFLSSD